MEVPRYLLSGSPFTTRWEEDGLERIGNDPSQVMWAIVLKHNGRLIGNAALEHLDWRNRRAESGTVIGEKDEWGKGYAGEAMRLRTRYAFRELGLETVTTRAVIANAASRRGLERAGHRQARGLRHHYFEDGRSHYAWAGEILTDECEAAAQKTRWTCPQAQQSARRERG